MEKPDDGLIESARAIIQEWAAGRIDGRDGTPDDPNEAFVWHLAAALHTERERCAQTALELGWRADASDAMRVAATTIAAAIRALR